MHPSDLIYIAIDIGNTYTKMWIENGAHSTIEIYPHAEWKAVFVTKIRALPQATPVIIGYIASGKDEDISFFEETFVHPPRIFKIDAHFPFPIVNLYSTPHTLGTDRLVAMIGAQSLVGNGKPILVMNAGTALTYDAANAEGAYLGGGISPGIRMRFRALHTFTARLPLIETYQHTALIGDSTYNSMVSGVVNGIVGEIQYNVAQYIHTLGSDLQVFLAGGDAEFLSPALTFPHFTERHLVLKGVMRLLKGGVKDAST